MSDKYEQKLRGQIMSANLSRE